MAVIDVAMPRLNGVETTRELRRRVPDTRILILSMYGDEAYVTQILRGRRPGLSAEGFR